MFQWGRKALKARPVPAARLLNEASGTLTAVTHFLPFERRSGDAEK
jgi:hypothetical protein